MLESLLDDPDCPPVSLYWGQRQAEELYLDAELRSWSERLYEFRYVPVLSRAGAGWPGRRGHAGRHRGRLGRPVRSTRCTCAARPP
jgi:CDP-4-dehydro-6-deoxyglucose reductase